MNALWEQFSLRERAEYGAGLVYAVKYETPRLEAHRAAVIAGLEQLGAVAAETTDGITVIMKGEPPVSAWPLLQELSLLNEALECHDLDLHGPLTSVTQKLSAMVQYVPVTRGKIDMAQAYDCVITVLSLAYELQKHRATFSSSDRRSIDDLVKKAKRAEKTLGSNNKYILLS